MDVGAVASFVTTATKLKARTIGLSSGRGSPSGAADAVSIQTVYQMTRSCVCFGAYSLHGASGTPTFGYRKTRNRAMPAAAVRGARARSVGGSKRPNLTIYLLRHMTGTTVPIHIARGA